MGTLMKKEIWEQWRTYRYLIVLAVLVLFGLASPLLARYMPEFIASLPGATPELAALIPPATVADAVGQYVKNMAQFVIILSLLVPMGAIVQEKERGTAAMLLSKPVSIASFVLSKFVALSVTFAAGLLLAALGSYYYTGVLFEWVNLGHYTLLNGFLLLYVCVYVSLTLLASSLARSQVAAGGIAFAFYLVLLIPESIPRVGDYLPGAMMMWGSRLLLHQPGNSAWVALGVSVGLLGLALLGSWAILRAQEI